MTESEIEIPDPGYERDHLLGGFMEYPPKMRAVISDDGGKSLTDWATDASDEGDLRRFLEMRQAKGKMLKHRILRMPSYPHWSTGPVECHSLLVMLGGIDGWWCRISTPFGIGDRWRAGFCPHDTTGFNGIMDHRGEGVDLMDAVTAAAVRIFLDDPVRASKWKLARRPPTPLRVCPKCGSEFLPPLDYPSDAACPECRGKALAGT